MEKVFIDGGAHSGETIKDLLDKRNDMLGSTIYFFEPNRSYANILYKIKESNKNYNIEVIMKALWIKNEILDFYTMTNVHFGDLGNTLLKENRLELDREHPNKVECISLSDFIIGLKDKYIVLKLDIEGAEFKVVPDLIETGAITFVKELYIEWHDRLYLKENSQPLKDRLTKTNIVLHSWD
jgi:FkbM family methyltransferase